MESRSQRYFDLWAGPVVCLLSLLSSIAALPQDLVWGDAPELSASAWILGVPHPTGYPLYMLLTRLFQAAPFGTVIFRAHCFSAVCSAAAAWILFSFLRRTLQSVFERRIPFTTLPAFAAALAWICTPIVWEQSHIAEVYALFALQFVLALWLFVYAIQQSKRALPPLAFLIGSMLIHHRLSIFILTAMGVFLILRFYKRTAHWFGDNQENQEGIGRVIIHSFLCFLLPLSLLIYLPLRALSQPAINWYDPQTVSRFYELISGKLYAGTLSQSLQGVLQSDLYSILTGFLYLLVLSFLCYSLLAAPILWGFWILRKKLPWLLFFTISLFTMHQVFVYLYRVGDWQVFLLPSLITLTIPLAFGVAGIFEQLEQNEIAKPVIALAAVFFLFASLLPLWVRFDQSGGVLENPFSPANFLIGNGEFSDRFASARDLSIADYASNVWQKIPNGAPLLTGLTYETADNELNPLLYQQVVEHRNPDSPLIGAGFIHLDWYREAVSRKINIPLPPNRDRLFLSRDAWLQTTWEELIDPMLRKGQVYSASFSITNPPPKTWLSKAEFQYLGMIPIDRTLLPPYYTPYVPGGHIYKISAKQSNPIGNQP